MAEKIAKKKKPEKPAEDVTAKPDNGAVAAKSPGRSAPMHPEAFDKGIEVLTKLADSAESEQIRLDAATRLVDFGRY